MDYSFVIAIVAYTAFGALIGGFMLYLGVVLHLRYGGISKNRVYDAARTCEYLLTGLIIGWFWGSVIALAVYGLIDDIKGITLFILYIGLILYVLQYMCVSLVCRTCDRGGG